MEYTDLIERLAEKTLSFGCEFKAKNQHNKPCKGVVLANGNFDWPIGNDVLHSFEEEENCDCGFKITKILGHPVLLGTVLEKMKAVGELPDGFYKCPEKKLLDLWRKCGFTKSLSEIYEEKPEGWKELFDFLISIF